jgi:hypothetical protein
VVHPIRLHVQVVHPIRLHLLAPDSRLQLQTEPRGHPCDVFVTFR